MCFTNGSDSSSLHQKADRYEPAELAPSERTQDWIVGSLGGTCVVLTCLLPPAQTELCCSLQPAEGWLCRQSESPSFPAGRTSRTEWWMAVRTPAEAEEEETISQGSSPRFGGSTVTPFHVLQICLTATSGNILKHRYVIFLPLKWWFQRFLKKYNLLIYNRKNGTLAADTAGLG